MNAFGVPPRGRGPAVLAGDMIRRLRLAGPQYANT